ncbi:CoA transferase [Tsukamurella sp. NPDC003166]|uniref:CaiB/BaiF CoA transferase family protein n=1 Tax=Tsukamurella sp. NPDC003166 TaxID=3154444 RepID=UPI0033B4657D
MSGPLEGVRVLDLTSNFMGPFAALLLADMGADVCKIESRAGDTSRGVGTGRNPGMGPIFLHLNRNKRSLGLDLKHADAKAALRRMLPEADVLMYSLRPASMARLGLSYAEVAEVNPRLIYAGAFGFGQGGQYADKPAYDDLIQASVGMPVLQSRKVGAPEYVATAIADRVVGMAMSNAIAMALYRRERTGRGQEVQIPMFETFAQFVMGDHLYGHTFEPPIGDWGYARMMNPDRRPYQTTDGYVGVNVYTDAHWQRFFALVERPDLLADPRFATISARTENFGVLLPLVAEIFATRSTAEWLQLLGEADIPVIAMNTPESLLDDPHMKDVDFFRVEEHPTEGLIRTMGIPQTWSESAPEQRFPAPQLGGNTRELLREYGFSDDEVQSLVSEGAAFEK